MRILIFNWRDRKHSWAGGGEIYVFEQASRWVKRGHEVTLFCGEDPYRSLPSYEVIRGIKVYRKGGRFRVYLWAVWYYLTRFRGKMDIVIDVVNGVPFFTPFFCRVSKMCFVFHVHDRQFFYELPFLLSYLGFFVERFIFPFVYQRIPVVAISQTTKRQLIRIGFNKENIRVVYCGIGKSKKVAQNSMRKFSNPTILYLGRIKAYKRIDLLVYMFPKIVEKIPRARLLIAGWGTEASYLADLVMRSPLRRRIRLVGPVNDMEKKQLLAKSWVFVNPSIGEGWSIAIIEANLYGTPAVAFDVDGLSESIKHGETGLLAENEEDMVNKICTLLVDKTLCEKLGENARLWAKKFDWDKTARESLRIISHVYEQS